MPTLMANPAESPRGNGDFRSPPVVEDWKTQLRAEIERTFTPLVDKAREEKNQKLVGRQVDPKERQRIEEDYEATMKSLRRIAEEQFREALEREGSRRMTGKNSRQYSTSSVEGQQAIMEQIQRQRKTSEPAAGTSNSIYSPRREGSTVESSGDISGSPNQIPAQVVGRDSDHAIEDTQGYSPPYSMRERLPVGYSHPTSSSRHPPYRVEDAVDLDVDWSPLAHFPVDFPPVTRKQSNSSLSSTRTRQESGRYGVPPSADYLPSSSRTMGFAGTPSAPSPGGTLRRSSNASVNSTRSGIAIASPQRPPHTPHSPTPPSASSPSPYSLYQLDYRHREFYEEPVTIRNDKNDREDLRGPHDLSYMDGLADSPPSSKVRNQPPAPEYFNRRMDTRPLPLAHPASSPISPELPRTPDSYRQPSVHSIRRPESIERGGIPIPLNPRSPFPPQSSPDYPRGSPTGFGATKAIGPRGSFTSEDFAQYPASSPRNFTMRRQNSSGSRRSGRSIGPQSPRSDLYARDAEAYPGPAMETYQEQSATDTDGSDDEFKDCGFDVEALYWRQQEQQLLGARKMEEARRKEEEAERKEREARRQAEEAQRKEEEAKKKEEEAIRKEEEAKKREEEAKRITEDARRKEEELRRKEEELRWREEELRRREELAKKENELKKRELELERREAAVNEERRRVQEEERRLAEEERIRETIRVMEEQRRDAEREAAKREAEKREAEEREQERQREAARREAVWKEAERKEYERREAERGETERVEAERREILREAARREAARKEAERRELERREAAMREFERQEAERREVEREEAARKEAERKDTERKEYERREAERREAEREAEREEAERREILRREAERRAVAKREAERIAQQEAQRQAAELERERLERERMEQEAAARAARERVEMLAKAKALEEAERSAREEEDRRMAQAAQEEEDRRMAADLDRKEKEEMMRREGLRRAQVLAEQEQRRVQGAKMDEPIPVRTPLSSASQAAASQQDSGPWAIPGHRQGSTASTGSTSSNASDRTGATSSSSESAAGSTWSSWSNFTGGSYSSTASRPSSTIPPTSATNKSGSTAWRKASRPTPTSPHSTTGSYGDSYGFGLEAEEERLWRERQAEQVRRQQEQYQRQEAEREKQRQASEMRALSKDVVAQRFERDEQVWVEMTQKDVLRWRSFPWPVLRVPERLEELTASSIKAYVLNPYAPKDRSERDRLKDNIRRWHPDRFNNKFLSKVPGEEREKVQAGAAVVIQTLNELLNQLGTS